MEKVKKKRRKLPSEAQPIRNRVDLEEFGKKLKERDEKYFVLLRLGVTTGLRISDILNLKVSDVLGKSHITITEKKTKKKKTFKLNSKVRNLCEEFVIERDLEDDDYIIYSNKKDKDNNNKAISRFQAYRVLNEVGTELGLESIATHTLRKTFGYWHYKQFNDVALLQKMFNHSSPSITLTYIGITQDEIDRTMEEFDI